MNKFIFIFIGLSIIGCAPKAQKTKLKISLALASQSFPGGLILVGNRDGGESFSIVVDSSDSAELELPNGEWTFGVMGWKDPTGSGILNMEGDMFCDTKTGQDLTGEEVELSFDTSKEKCASNPVFFGDKFNGNDSYELEFNTCLEIKSNIQTGGSPSDSTVCGDLGYPSSGEAGSVKITLQTKYLNGNSGGEIQSQCIDFSGSQASSNIKLPFSNNLLNSSYKVETFESASCVNPMDVYAFVGGLVGPANDFRGGVSPRDTDYKLRVFLHVDACTGGTLASTDPSGPSGGPYVVCNAEQFEKIATGTFEADAIYELRRDIDFNDLGGTNTTKTADFSGSIVGNNYSIKNGTNPLFKTYKLAAVGSDSRFKDFTIENFHFSGSDSNPVGLLFNEVKNISSTTEGRVEIDNISVVNSTVHNANTVNIEPVGGLIGHIDLASAVVNQEIEIRNSNFQIDVTNDTDDDGGYTGGIIGKSRGNGNFGRIDISNVSVGTDDVTQKVTVLGRSSVGIITGSSQSTNISNLKFVRGIVRGRNDVGGLVGRSGPDTNISDSNLDIEFKPNLSYSGSSNVGGVVGKVDDTASVIISGLKVKFYIENVNYEAALLGGVVGGVQSGGESNLLISNTKVDIDVSVDGIRQGGIIGQFDASSASSDVTVSNSLVVGRLLEHDAQTLKSPNRNFKGAIVGYGKNIKINQVIVEDRFEISGKTRLGGVAGSIVGDSTLSEIDLSVEIYSDDETSTQYVAGIIGSNLGTSGALKNKNIKLEGFIEFEEDVSNCDTTQGCGILTGVNSDNSILDGWSDIIYDFHITQTTATTATSITQPPTIGGDLNINASEDIFSEFTTANCSMLISQSLPYVDNGGECDLLFANKWRDSGTSSSVLLAGNSVEPFEIHTIDDWNKIGEDELLLTKSYKLMNDLSFNGQSFVRIGTGAIDASLSRSFTGEIIPNGNSLNDITVGDSTSFYSGVFSSIDDGARIGREGDQLVVNNLNVECNTICGLIGIARGGDISVVVNSGSIKGSGANGSVIGGLVGEVDGGGTGHLRIYKSGYNGEVTGKQVLGGLIGKHAKAYLDIDSSYSNLSYIGAPSDPDETNVNFVGGLIGLTQNFTPLDMKIRNSYARFESGVPMLQNAHTSNSGLIGEHQLPAGNTIIRKAFVDVSGGGILPANFVEIAKADSGGGFDSSSEHTAFIGASGFVVGLEASSHSRHLSNAAFVNDSAFGNFEELKVDTSGKAVLWWE